MASASDNLMTMFEQPYWRFRTPTSTYGDNNPWSNLSMDMFVSTTRENEAAAVPATLQEIIIPNSFPRSSQYVENDDVLKGLPSSGTTNMEYNSGGAVFSTPTGSDSDGKQQKPATSFAVGPSSGRVTKRKPRASKRQSTTTTFITADPENFRQMVQQVTGVRFGSGGDSAADVAHIMKPHAHRRLATTTSAFDGSEFLLGGGSVSASASASLGQAGSGAVDFDSFGSFPTLESWKV